MVVQLLYKVRKSYTTSLEEQTKLLRSKQLISIGGPFLKAGISAVIFKQPLQSRSQEMEGR